MEGTDFLAIAMRPSTRSNLGNVVMLRQPLEIAIELGHLVLVRLACLFANSLCHLYSRIRSDVASARLDLPAANTDQAYPLLLDLCKPLFRLGHSPTARSCIIVLVPSSTFSRCCR